MKTTSEYLACAVNARAVYEALWEAATATLPPDASQGTHIVSCYYTAKDLVAKLPGRTVSIIRNELVWLVNWGWIESNSRRPDRHLGRLVDGTYYLLADLAARNATGVPRLISKEILGFDYLEADKPPEVTHSLAARGATRQWRGKDTKSGGTLGFLGT